MKKETYNKIIDDLIDEAIDEYVEIEENEETTEVEFSDIHKYKMEQLFKEERQKEKVKNYMKITKRVAIVVVGVTIIMTMSMPSISAWKEKIVKFFRKDETNYSWILKGDPADAEKLDLADNSEKEKPLFLNYVPEGYDMYFVDDMPGSINIKFESGDKNIGLKVVKEDINKAIDRTNVELEVLFIEDNEIFLFKKGETKTYAWNKNNYLIRLYGNANEEILIEIIKGINYEKIKEYL